MDLFKQDNLRRQNTKGFLALPSCIITANQPLENSPSKRLWKYKIQENEMKSQLESLSFMNSLQDHIQDAVKIGNVKSRVVNNQKKIDKEGNTEQDEESENFQSGIKEDENKHQNGKKEDIKNEETSIKEEDNLKKLQKNKLAYMNLLERSTVDLTNQEDSDIVIHILDKECKNKKEQSFLQMSIQGLNLFKKNSDILFKGSSSSSLFRELKHEFFKAKEEIFNFGDFGYTYYIVLKGVVQLLIPKPEIAKEIEKKREEKQNTSSIAKVTCGKDKSSLTPSISNSKNLASSNTEGEQNKNDGMTYEQKLEKMYKGWNQIKAFFPGEAFGEIALLTKQRRTGTMICKEDTHLMSLSKDAFDNIMGRYHERVKQEKIGFLRQFQVFDGVPNSKLMSLLHDMKVNIYQINNVLYEEGDKVEYIYFIKQGEVEISKLTSVESNSEPQKQQQQQKYDQLQFEPQDTKFEMYNLKMSRQIQRQKLQRVRIALICSGECFGDKEIKEEQDNRTEKAMVVNENTEIYSLHKSLLIDMLKTHKITENIIKQNKLNFKFHKSRESGILQQIKSNQLTAQKLHKAHLRSQLKHAMKLPDLSQLSQEEQRKLYEQFPYMKLEKAQLELQNNQPAMQKIGKQNDSNDLNEDDSLNDIRLKEKLANGQIDLKTYQEFTSKYLKKPIHLKLHQDQRKKKEALQIIRNKRREHKRRRLSASLQIDSSGRISPSEIFSYIQQDESGEQENQSLECPTQKQFYQNQERFSQISRLPLNNEKNIFQNEEKPQKNTTQFQSKTPNASYKPKQQITRQLSLFVKSNQSQVTPTSSGLKYNYEKEDEYPQDSNFTSAISKSLIQIRSSKYISSNIHLIEDSLKQNVESNEDKEVNQCQESNQIQTCSSFKRSKRYHISLNKKITTDSAIEQRSLNVPESQILEQRKNVTPSSQSQQNITPYFWIEDNTLLSKEEMRRRVNYAVFQSKQYLSNSKININKINVFVGEEKINVSNINSKRKHSLSYLDSANRLQSEGNNTSQEVNRLLSNQKVSVSKKVKDQFFVEEVQQVEKTTKQYVKNLVESKQMLDNQSYSPKVPEKTNEQIEREEIGFLEGKNSYEVNQRTKNKVLSSEKKIPQRDYYNKISYTHSLNHSLLQSPDSSLILACNSTQYNSNNKAMPLQKKIIKNSLTQPHSSQRKQESQLNLEPFQEIQSNSAINKLYFSCDVDSDYRLLQNQSQSSQLDKVIDSIINQKKVIHLSSQTKKRNLSQIVSNFLPTSTSNSPNNSYSLLKKADETCDMKQLSNCNKYGFPSVQFQSNSINSNPIYYPKHYLQKQQIVSNNQIKNIHIPRSLKITSLHINNQKQIEEAKKKNFSISGNSSSPEYYLSKIPTQHDDDYSSSSFSRTPKNNLYNILQKNSSRDILTNPSNSPINLSREDFLRFTRSFKDQVKEEDEKQQDKNVQAPLTFHNDLLSSQIKINQKWTSQLRLSSGKQSDSWIDPSSSSILTKHTPSSLNSSLQIFPQIRKTSNASLNQKARDVKMHQLLQKRNLL